MGVTPPFIYDKPSSYTFEGPTGRGFNPKAATQASWTPKQPKPKQDGPLVTFNRHPDSWHQAPYGNTSAVPMNPRTKDQVTLAWKAQRVLRALGILGALAAVFCIISIRKTSTTVGWIIRAGPGVALCHTLYALYFFCRGPNARAPTSAASYQMFAGLLDTGLIPFLTFACYMATLEHTQGVYGWTTLFDDKTIDRKIVEIFMIASGIETLLLLISLIMDTYLAVVYRKIANLPPDMNPLEEKDNLTARPHHKRNKSELIYDKHLSNSTLASQRFSQMTDTTDSSRRIPYKHARTDSSDRDSFSFQKDFVNEFKDPYSARASMSMDRHGNNLSRPSSAVVPAANARPVGAGLDFKPVRSSGLARASTITRPTSWLSYADYEGTPADVYDYAHQEYEQQTRSLSPVSTLHEHDNHTTWQERPQEQTYQPQSSPQQYRHEQVYPTQTHAHPPSTHQDQENDLPSPIENNHLGIPEHLTPPRKRSRDPLGMNPPTPVNQYQFVEADLMVKPLQTSSHLALTPQRQTIHDRDVDTNSVVFATPASRPSSFIGSGNKSRFYGNLRTSIGGSPSHSPTRASHDTSSIEMDIPSVSRTSTFKSAVSSANFEVYASDSDSDVEYDPYRVVSGNHGPAEEVVVRELTPGRLEWNGTRQISNSTGHDLGHTYAGLDPEFGKGMARRREVSGKVAEEGRGGEVLVKEVRTGMGAAGWARFKGL